VTNCYVLKLVFVALKKLVFVSPGINGQVFHPNGEIVTKDKCVHSPRKNRGHDAPPPPSPTALYNNINFNHHTVKLDETCPCQ
jgi:hypothetical protein